MTDHSQKPVALILGGTLPHCELVQNLKKRGYHTVLVDYLLNPPAKEFADEHIQESTLDVNVVLEIAREREAKLVISVCIDQANVTAAWVSEVLELPAPYGSEVAQAVTHKVLMKQRMLDHDIPTSRFVRGSCIDDFVETNLTYPLIVKPVDSNSSKGIRKISDQSELEAAVIDAIDISRCDEVILEEYVEGVEVGVDCYIEDGKAHVLITKERRKIPLDKTDEQQIFGCIWPSDLADQHREDFIKIAESIGRAFHLNNSPLMLQAIVNDNGINIVEFGARFGGGESVKIIKLATGVDIVDVSVDCFLRNKVSLQGRETRDYYAENFIYVKPCVFDSVRIANNRNVGDQVEYLNVYRKPGTKIGDKLSSNNRVGAFAVKGGSPKDLLTKLAKLIPQTEVYDTDGKPVMRKDIYENSF